MRCDCIIKQLVVVFLLFPILLQLLKTTFNKSEGVLSANPLDGCLHVYLDLCTNTGVQIRKLFEPHKFQAADILPIFYKYVGPVVL